MIKGHERKVIVIEKMDSPYFDKAVFYVKKGAHRNVSKKSLAVTAQQMISLYQDEGAPSLSPARVITLDRTEKMPAVRSFTRKKIWTKRKTALFLGVLAGGSAVATVIIKLLF